MHRVPKIAKSVSVLAADDHPVVFAGLSALLSTDSDIKLIDQARDGREAVEMFLEHQPDVGLFDLRLDVIDGIEAATQILAKLPGARIVIFTDCRGEEDVYRAVRAGIQGYIFKNASAEELAGSIRAVAAGQQWISPYAAAKLARRLADREVTTREREVLERIYRGKSNKEIGLALNISESTVKVHVTHILAKLKATGRTDAIRLAAQRGLVYLDSADPLTPA
jgi:DNA-binding NarL/FixJ family response regulator